MVLIPLLLEPAEHDLEALAFGLRAEGYAHLLVDGDGRLLGMPGREPGLTVYVPADEEAMIRERIAGWLGRSKGEGSPQQEEEGSIPLVRCDNQVESALIRDLLDEAGISYTTLLDPGSIAGVFGHMPSVVRFFVAQSDHARADELLDQLDVETEGNGAAEGNEDTDRAWFDPEEATRASHISHHPGAPSAQESAGHFRVERVARWMLVIQGIILLMAGLAFMATLKPLLLLVPLIGALLIWISTFAGSQPRKAFGLALLLQIPLVAFGLAFFWDSGLLLLPGVFYLLVLVSAYRNASQQATGPGGVDR